MIGANTIKKDLPRQTLAAAIACALWLLLGIIAAFGESENHTVEKGETALQIAIDHDLSMEQLQLLNPDLDLEMLMVGDEVILPPTGVSFEEFLVSFYAERLQIRDLHCERGADNSAYCLMNAENISQQPLYNIRLKFGITDADGRQADQEGSIALIQILPQETLPIVVTFPGPFHGALEGSCSVIKLDYNEAAKGSFRIDPQTYTLQTTILPDASAVKIGLLFNSQAGSAYTGKQVNILAAAYNSEGKLIGVRSLFGDFQMSLDLDVYAIGGLVSSAKTWVETY